MKHRPDMVERFEDEVNEFIAVLYNEDDKAAEDAYKKITAKGLYIVVFFLSRINDKIAFLFGILIAALLIGK